MLETHIPTHQSVLLEEVVEFLELPNKKVIVDGTLGLGGHTKAILENAPEKLKVVVFEVDDENRKFAQTRLKEFGKRVKIIQKNFSSLKESLEENGFQEIDGLLLDLGLSSPQVDFAERGFSFMKEGPLDMRFDKEIKYNAADVLRRYSESELSRIFYEYGDEKFSRKIAKGIVERRRTKLFETTTELADFISSIVKVKGRVHPATRVFQALRIEVNQELTVLADTLFQSLEVLRPGGRLLVISYHSLEDAVVKRFFKEHSREYVNLPDDPNTVYLNPKLKIITRKPVGPTPSEIRANPRARSAKLRVAEKI